MHYIKIIYNLFYIKNYTIKKQSKHNLLKLQILKLLKHINRMKQDDFQQRFVHYQQDQKILNDRQLTALQKKQVKDSLKLQKQNVTNPQNNSHKQGFIAEPKVIQFKDFTVGKPHYLVLTLTNIHEKFNSFNVMPLPPKIRNYFEVQYKPKGKISPGINTEIRFKFLPQLNQDIRSQFTIVAQTGKISFDIVCLSKKTIVKCQNPQVNFGKVIFGESGNAKLKLTNQGSLPSDLKIQCIKIENSDQRQTYEALNQIKFQPVSYIQGNSQKYLNFQFIPSKIGVFQAQFQVYISNFIHSPPIRFKVSGICTQVPVRIQKKLYDFEICLLNHIYRQKLIFYNNGQIPMSFKIIQPNQTKKYFQFNPIIGYIQKQSRIDIWIKFTAQKDLSIYLSKYMIDQSIYEIPFQMSVKQQILPVEFIIKFKITSQKINIKPSQLNFGTIFEGLSSKIQITLENQSDLPQEVLLHPLKKNISVENDQPLFKILPKQTIKTFITYRTKKLEENGKSQKQQGTIPCKIITGDIATNQIKIQYSAQTLRPDLFIQKNKIQLPASQINQICQVTTVFKNNSNKQIIYELFYPFFQITGLKITPAVKVLGPKQEVEVNIQYHSAYRKLTASTLNQIRKKYQKKQVTTDQTQIKKVEEDNSKKDSKKQAKKEVKLTKQQQQALEAQQKRLQQQERLKKERQIQQLMEMQRNFDLNKQLQQMGGKLFDFGQTQHYRWLMPIYFKQKEYPDASAQVNFIEITTTSVAKTLVIDREEIDFGQIAVGSRAVQQLNIQNKGDQITLQKKQLPIFCCFSLLNSLKNIRKDEKFKGVIQFQPIEEQRFQQRIEFFSDKHTVSCLLKGKGVRPQIKLEPENGLLNMGAVLLDQFSQKTFTVKNICNFPIQFLIKRIGEGILNSNSSRAISYIPMTGTIQPNQVTQVKVIFKPDRIGQDFFQKIKIHVQQQKQQKFLYISALCYPRQAYIKKFKENKMPSDEQIKKKIQSPFDWLMIKDQNKIFGASNKSIVLEFQKMSFEGQQDKQACFKRKITVGSCKLLDPKNQKPTNFQIIMSKDDKFFQCDNLKGVSAPGSQTQITFTFKPQQMDPFISKIPVLVGVGQWKQVKAQLKFSGGFTKPGVTDAISFDIILRAYISQL